MKQLVSILVILVAIAACNTSGQKQDSNRSKEVAATANAYASVEDLLHKADQLIDKEVKLTAVVSHTCKHSGKRCFLVDANGEESVRVEAGGNINGFNRELIGKAIQVSGVLKERRLTSEYIDQWEEASREKAVKEDGSAETCAAENNNITKMRDWMKANGKAYYSIYFIKGKDYDLVQ